MKIVEPYVKLVHATENPEKLIELAGRLCYKSEDAITEGSAPSFIEMLKRRGHLSVLEHATASFIIGTDRGVTHELVRHRIASYSQTSTRYCNYGKGKFGGEISVVKPIELPDNGCDRVWEEAVREAEVFYLGLLSRGVSPQTARSVLPTCLFTEIAMTANFREWLHFIELRTSPAAHPDMRRVAVMIQQALRLVSSTIFN